MSFTRQQWVKDFLRLVGNPNPSQVTIWFVCGWSAFEIPMMSNNTPWYNLLATTQTAPGATNFNAVGVKNYTSYDQGVNANAATLKNGRYPALLSAVTSNNDNLLKNPSSAMVANLNTWGTGYKVTFWQTGQSHANDVTSYGTAPTTPPLANVPGLEINSQTGTGPGPNSTDSTQPNALDILQNFLDPMFLAKMGIGIVCVSLGLYFLIKGVIPNVSVK